MYAKRSYYTLGSVKWKHNEYVRNAERAPRVKRGAHSRIIPRLFLEYRQQQSMLRYYYVENTNKSLLP